MTEMTEKKYLQNIVNTLVKHNGNRTEAAKALDLPRSTFYGHLARAESIGIVPTVVPTNAQAVMTKLQMEHKVAFDAMKKERDELAKNALDTDRILENVFRLAQGANKSMEWAPPPSNSTKNNSRGVPVLFLSDWHWGEIVDKKQVNNYNEFNNKIAKRRFRNCINNAIDVIGTGSVPGITVLLGGDMVGGEIHEELQMTNEMSVMEAVLDLYDELVWALNTLKATYGKVFVASTYGNHGRMTMHKPFKNAAFTNADWLITTMLEKHYSLDDDIVFNNPSSFDTHFKIYNTHFMLTHGDRLGVRGGDGQIGIVGPIVRGVNKLRRQAETIGQVPAIVCMGHYHTPLWLESQNTIVNGCGKGFDEFAMGMRFVAQPPTQNLWFVHDKYGINNMTHIQLDNQQAATPAPWVSILGD